MAYPARLLKKLANKQKRGYSSDLWVMRPLDGWMWELDHKTSSESNNFFTNRSFDLEICNVWKDFGTPFASKDDNRTQVGGGETHLWKEDCLD